MNAIPTVAATVAAVNPLDVLMAGINSNPYFIGIMMLLLNLGGRFLSMEITKDQEKFLSQPMIRRFFLFAILFVATRNIIIAACLSVIVILFLGYLFNENSDLCLWKKCNTPKKEGAIQEGFIGLTPEETMILKRLQDKQRAAQAPAESKTQEEKPENPLASSQYNAALSKIGSGSGS